MRQFGQDYRWNFVLNSLQQSLYAEQMVCSMSTQLFHIPETRDLEGNEEMHSHLVPASYHRVTATGSAQRIVNGEREGSIFATLAACVQNASRRDEQVRRGLFVMRDAATPRYKPFIQTIIAWQERAEFHLQAARRQIAQFAGAYAGQPYP